MDIAESVFTFLFGLFVLNSIVNPEGSTRLIWHIRKSLRGVWHALNAPIEEAPQEPKKGTFMPHYVPPAIPHPDTLSDTSGGLTSEEIRAYHYVPVIGNDNDVPIPRFPVTNIRTTSFQWLQQPHKSSKRALYYKGRMIGADYPRKYSELDESERRDHAKAVLKTILPFKGSVYLDDFMIKMREPEWSVPKEQGYGPDGIPSIYKEAVVNPSLINRANVSGERSGTSMKFCEAKIRFGNKKHQTIHWKVDPSRTEKDSVQWLAYDHHGEKTAAFSEWSSTEQGESSIRMIRNFSKEYKDEIFMDDVKVQEKRKSTLDISDLFSDEMLETDEYVDLCYDNQTVKVRVTATAPKLTERPSPAKEREKPSHIYYLENSIEKHREKPSHVREEPLFSVKVSNHGINDVIHWKVNFDRFDAKELQIVAFHSDGEYIRPKFSSWIKTSFGTESFEKGRSMTSGFWGEVYMDDVRIK